MGKLKLIILGLALCFSAGSYAQKLDLEKTYEITGKSKRGTLSNVELNSENQYVLSYVTKATDFKAKFEIYYFDKDFNFIKMDKDEIEFDKAKAKYKWFKFKGEEYSVEGNTVEPNLMGTLILKKKRITYNYDWWSGSYYKHVDLLEKVKPKTEDGRKFFYLKHTEDDQTGDILVLCGVKDKTEKGSDPYRQYKDMYLLKFNKDLDLVKETSLKFDYPQTIAFSREISDPNAEDPENPGVAGMALVFAPMGVGKASDPTTTNYTYVRTNADGSLAEKIPFTSTASFWKIDELVIDWTTNSFYLFGPSAAGKTSYYNNLIATTKFKAVQFMKIQEGKIGFLTETNLEEFATKLKAPPSQKKTPEYEGKKFEIMGYKIGSNGDFYIFGQNYKPNQDKGNQYNDIIAFHFDREGKLKAQYGLDVKESNEFSKAAGTPQVLVEGADKNNVYWLVREIKDVTNKGRLLTYPRLGKIDANAGTVSDFQKYGGKNDFFLDPKFPFLETPTGNNLVFFGADKGGKTLWFARVKLD